MASVTIQLSDKDLRYLTELATNDHRRLKDFVQILFATGLQDFYCEREAHVRKDHDDYTPEDRKQMELNYQLEADYPLLADQKKHGFQYVATYLHNGAVTDPMVKRIQAFALK